MPTRRPTAVSVVISIPTLSTRHLLETVAGCMKELADYRELDNVPLHWSFPVRAFETDSTSQSRLVPLIRGRVASGRDMLLPRGYAATPHSLLLPEDVRRDLDWAASNPWNSGVSDLYPRADYVLFPDGPDWLRDSVRSVYESDKRTILLRYYDETIRGFVYFLKTNSFRKIHEVQFDVSKKNLKPALLRQSRKFPHPVLVVAEIYPGSPSDTIPRVFETLSKCIHPRLNYQNLSDIAEATHYEDLQTESIKKPAPGVRFSPEMVGGSGGYTHREISTAIRNRRTGRAAPLSGDKETKERLISLSGASDEVRQERSVDALSEFALKERTLIADMSGLVTLEDREISAQFDDGRLTNVLLQGSPVLCGQTVSSYYMEESDRHQTMSEGAFSFEGDRIHGLRSSQTIVGKGITKAGSIITDFFFLEGYRCLFICVVCVYPFFEPGITVGSLACLELPVFSIPRAGGVRAEARLLNGERYGIDLPRSSMDYVLPGNSFCLKNGSSSFFLVFPEAENNSQQLLPIRVARIGRRYIVLLNPGGSYRPVPGDNLSGYATRMVIALDPQNGSVDKFPNIRSDVFAETGLPWSGLHTSSSGRL